MVHTKVMQKSEQVTRLERIPDYYGEMSPFVFTLRTLFEMIPFGIGPYGIGDALSLIEGIRGKMVLGRKLDLLDRIISIIAALIPVVPATPFREFARKTRQRIFG